MKHVVCILAVAFALDAMAAAPEGLAPCKPPERVVDGFVADGPLEALRVPLDDWSLDAAAKGGFVATVTNVVIGGETVPALQLCGSSATNCNPWNWPASAFRRFQFRGDEWPVVSFKAKVDIPKAAFYPVFKVSGSDHSGSTVAVRDDHAAVLGADGWQEVFMDLQNAESVTRTPKDNLVISGLKAAYPLETLPTGVVVTLTIADMKLVKGAHIKFEEPERWKAWLGFCKSYAPDYGDSSKYLEPPQEGRLPAGSSVRLASGGQARAEIVVDLSDAIRIDNFFPTNTWNLELRAARGHETPVARLAACELAHWLKEITGGDFPVLTAPSKADNVKIFLGATYAKDFFPEDLKKLTSGGSTDGFAVRVKGDNVYIFGARPAGTLYGVYRFIENNTDLIWAYPFDDEGATVYTKDPDLKAVWGDACVKPAFIQRGWQDGDADWMRHNGSNFGLAGQLDQGIFQPNGGHYLSPQYYDWCTGLRRFNPVVTPGGERLERWSEYKGLCCLADPEFIRHSVETVPNIDELDYTSPFDVVMGMDDNPTPCRCPACSKPIKAADGRTLTPNGNYEEYYDAWFYTYLNKVDDLIQKKHPGYVTSTYAYYYAKSYPPIKVNKTIVPWICLYPPSGRAEPAFSPHHRTLCRMYKDWTAHSKDVMLYDYYGLYRGTDPYAEIHQANLEFQRSIGFLRTSTEGFMGRDYLGGADDRWCMARLQWDPDADVEQLHRYFNRRTYREAAPWMDKFRGEIRRRVLSAQEFGARNAVKPEILRGYLAEAKKAVRHPMAKILVDKVAADFEYRLTSMWGRDLPSLPANRVVRARPAPTTAEAAFAEKGKGILGLAEKGESAAATNLLAAALADRLVPENARNQFLVRTALPAIIAGNPGFTGADAARLYRDLLCDDVGRAQGRSVYVNGWGGSGDIGTIANAFIRRGDFAGAAAVYDAWADWDGAQLPIGLRAKRLNAKMDRLRGEKALAERTAARCLKDREARPASAAAATAAERARTRLGDIMEAESRGMGAWRQALSRCVQGGATAQERGDAGLRLLKEDWDRMNGKQRRAAVDRLVFDDFMANGVRRDAAMLIPGAFADGAKTNWIAAADHVVKAISDGDWSNLGRTCYSRQGRDDFQLDVLCAAAEQMIAAGEKAAAKSMLERGAPVLGYTAAMKPGVAKEPFASEADMKKRLDQLDAVMAKCGAARK